MNRPLSIYSLFHLNLAYSSIEEEQRLKVIRCCYWPLLRLINQYQLPVGVEASGYTLEAISKLDPTWIVELKRLLAAGVCEFIGSGYAQLIGPLVPAEVNAANLNFGRKVYKKLLSFQPNIALVNEQAYSAGLIQHYLDAGYKAIIMEWDNPSRSYPEWNPEWRYLPQVACGQRGEQIPLIWNHSIAFQKFQRYAQGEMELSEYVGYVRGHFSSTPRAFPLYGNDAEIFNFRPGRYNTELPIREQNEWKRIEILFAALKKDIRFKFIKPSEVLDFLKVKGAGNRLHLESPEQPIPVKKQSKYNITRWSVTGPDDLNVNTACWRIYESLKSNSRATDKAWKELCYLWGSDFRTHITKKRWNIYLKRLKKFAAVQPRHHEERVPSLSPTGLQKTLSLRGRRRRPWQSRGLGTGSGSAISEIVLPSTRNDETQWPKRIFVKKEGHCLNIETNLIKLQLNCRRGLAIDRLCFKKVSEQWLCGTLYQGRYDDIHWGADYYSGHLVFESPGEPKITDLDSMKPEIEHDVAQQMIYVKGSLNTPLGMISKRIGIGYQSGCVEILYNLDWKKVQIGSLRLGHMTLNPEAFKKTGLFYRTHNGGCSPEYFRIKGCNINHGSPVSFLVSAQSGVGMTEGWIEAGDSKQVLRINVSRSHAALLGMVQYQTIGKDYFYRLSFSAQEMDETSRIYSSAMKLWTQPPSYRVTITAGKTSFRRQKIRDDIL